MFSDERRKGSSEDGNIMATRRCPALGVMLQEPDPPVREAVPAVRVDMAKSAQSL